VQPLAQLARGGTEHRVGLDHLIAQRVQRQAEERVRPARAEADREQIGLLGPFDRQRPVLQPGDPAARVRLADRALAIPQHAVRFAEVHHHLQRPVGQHLRAPVGAAAAHRPEPLDQRRQRHAGHQMPELEVDRLR
jgi:hypothetical protein